MGHIHNTTQNLTHWLTAVQLSHVCADINNCLTKRVQGQRVMQPHLGGLRNAWLSSWCVIPVSWQLRCTPVHLVNRPMHRLGCTDSFQALTPPTHPHTLTWTHTPPHACHTRLHLLKTSIVCSQGHLEAALCEQTGCSASSEEGGAAGCSAFPHACQANHMRSSMSCNHGNELWTSLHLMGLGKKE